MSAAPDGAARKIRARQGKPHSRVWHAGEHLIEFLEKYPQYAELVSADLENAEMSLTNFEAEIAKAARANGGGLGGKDADAVLRKFYGLPDEQDAAPAPESGGVHVELSDFL